MRLIQKLKRKGWHSRLVLYNVENDRGKHFRLCNVIQKGGKSLLCDVEFDIAIVYDVQHDSKRQALLSCVKLRLVQRQTLSCCTMVLVMTRRGNLGRLVWCWIWNREVNTVVLCYVEYDREGNCDGSVWRDEWRHKREKSRWAFVRISVSVRWAHVRPVGFCPVGFCSPTRPSISKRRMDSSSISTRTRTFFFPSDTVSPRFFGPCMIRL